MVLRILKMTKIQGKKIMLDFHFTVESFELLSEKIYYSATVYVFPFLKR